MRELFAMLIVWVAAETGLPAPPAPTILLASEAQIGKLMGGNSWSGNVRGVYEWDTATVYLREDWDPADLRSQATLLHELVHHVQATYSVAHDCRAALERQAYHLTVRWLEEHGIEDGYGFMGTDLFTVTAISMCAGS